LFLVLAWRLCPGVGAAGVISRFEPGKMGLKPGEAVSSGLTADYLLEYYRSRVSPRFLFGQADRREWGDGFRRLYPRDTAALIRQAKMVVGGREAGGLASGGFLVDPGLYDNGLEGIPYDKWLLLARAYWAGGDVRYAVESLNRIKTWLDRNPRPGGARGPAPWSPGETAARTWYLLYAWSYLIGSPAIGPETVELLLDGLWNHGDYLAAVEGGVEQPLAGAALMALALVFPEFRDSGEWLDRAYAAVERVMRGDVTVDGVLSGRPLPIQASFIGAMLRVEEILQLNGSRLKPALAERLPGMLKFVYHVARPSGTLPFSGFRYAYPVEGLFQLGSLVLGKGLFKAGAPPVLSPGVYWEVGPRGAERYRSLEASRPGPASRGFPYGGYFVLRSEWSDEARYLVARHGRPGAGGELTALLDFNLSAYGRDFVVDLPGGSGGTGYNTVAVDGKELTVPAGSGFRPRLHHFRPGNESGFVYLGCAGYSGVGDTVRFTRKIFSPAYEYFIMADRLEAGSAHLYRETIILADMPLAVSRDSQEVIVGGGPGGCLLIKNILPSGWKFTVDELTDEDRGGKSARLHRLRWEREKAGGTGFYLVLYPYITRGEAVRPSLKIKILRLETDEGPAGTDSSLAVRIRGPRYEDKVMIWSGPKEVVKRFENRNFSRDLYWERFDSMGRRLLKERWENPM